MLLITVCSLSLCLFFARNAYNFGKEKTSTADKTADTASVRPPRISNSKKDRTFTEDEITTRYSKARRELPAYFSDEAVRFFSTRPDFDPFDPKAIELYIKKWNEIYRKPEYSVDPDKMIAWAHQKDNQKGWMLAHLLMGPTAKLEDLRRLSKEEAFIDFLTEAKENNNTKINSILNWADKDPTNIAPHLLLLAGELRVQGNLPEAELRKFDTLLASKPTYQTYYGDLRIMELDYLSNALGIPPLDAEKYASKVTHEYNIELDIQSLVRQIMTETTSQQKLGNTETASLWASIALTLLQRMESASSVASRLDSIDYQKEFIGTLDANIAQRILPNGVGEYAIDLDQTRPDLLNLMAARTKLVEGNLATQYNAFLAAAKLQGEAEALRRMEK